MPLHLLRDEASIVLIEKNRRAHLLQISVFRSCFGNRSDAISPRTAMALESMNTRVNEPLRSAINPPIGGAIVWAMPKAKVAAAKLGP